MSEDWASAPRPAWRRLQSQSRQDAGQLKIFYIVASKRIHIVGENLKINKTNEKIEQ